eukprot:EG_transcript_24389
MPRMLGRSLLLQLLFGLLFLPGSKAARSPTFGMEHSLDGGQTWQPKGQVSVKVTGGVSEVRFQPAFAAWEGRQLEDLVRLANDGGAYLLRVPQTLTGEAPESTDYTMISLAPCLLFNTGFKEQYNLYPTVAGGAITGLVGLQNVAAKLKAGGKNFCEALAAPVLGAGPAIAPSSLPAPAKHTVVVGLSFPSRPPTVPDDVYVGVRAEQAPGQGGAQGPGQPPQEEKSFFQKYWLMILMCVTMMLVSGGGAAKQEAAREGEQGAAA